MTFEGLVNLLQKHLGVVSVVLQCYPEDEGYSYKLTIGNREFEGSISHSEIMNSLIDKTVYDIIYHRIINEVSGKEVYEELPE